MPHHTPLIATIVAGLVGAFVLGAVAQRFRISPLVGYLAAGVMVGPFTPGYVADQELANQLAEIGVILLMFGVGLHFSLRDLMAVRLIAVPGALGQMAAATVLGMGLAYLMGWPPVTGFVFGLALSVASTVVLLRALQQHRLIQTERGKIAVGWLIVEDLAMVLALVILPALADALRVDPATVDWAGPLSATALKVGGFVAFMLIVGRRVIPWVLHWAAHSGSRELFRLAVLAIALGVAFGAASLFGVSFALGAFFAGMILAESELSQRAAEETLPLRDAFAVLFFVSVGMLFNPAVLLQHPLAVAGVVGIIVVGKSLAAWGIVRAFGKGNETAVTVAASLAQIGEFSFILAGLGVELALLPTEGRDLILAGAILSILINPLLFRLMVRRSAQAEGSSRRASRTLQDKVAEQSLSEPAAHEGHTVLVGYGGVGQAVAAELRAQTSPFVLVETDQELAARAEQQGYAVVVGNAADPEVMRSANLGEARRVVVAVTDGLEAGGVVEKTRRSTPSVEIVARAHSLAEANHLLAHGASRVVMEDRAVAQGMLVAPSAAGPDPNAETSRNLAPLGSAEAVVLKAFLAADLWPGDPAEARAIRLAGASGGQSPEALEAALQSLRARSWLQDRPEGRLTLTRQGFLAALQLSEWPRTQPNPTQLGASTATTGK